MAENRSDILAEMLTPERRAKYDRVLAGRVRAVTVVLENLYDPHNISAVLRSCEALGIQDVHIVETEHKFKFSSGVTKGCEKWLSITRHADVKACVAALHAAGYEIVVADHRPGTPRIEGLPKVPRRAFWMGAEHFGLSDEARALADGRYIIPMHGFTESFNVSVAAAMTLYAARTRWETETGLAGDLSAAEKEDLRMGWLRRDFARADDILARFDVGDDRKSWRTPLAGRAPTGESAS
jgi:tRNA (guanosine-2'-O-)-methyltransferase